MYSSIIRIKTLRVMIVEVPIWHVDVFQYNKD